MSRLRWVLGLALAFLGVMVVAIGVRLQGGSAPESAQAIVPAGVNGGGGPPTAAPSIPKPSEPISSALPAGAGPALVALADVAPMRFVALPGGRFQMGSPAGEANRDSDETLHPAAVGPFELGLFEVTQKQWVAVMGTRPFKCDVGGCGDDLPAQKVSWVDAAKFMNALTDRENTTLRKSEKRTRCYDDKAWTWERECTGYRLPTEAEWEYAARAGTTTAYSFGSHTRDLCAYANGADRAAKRKHPDWETSNECDDGVADLAPVGKLKPNPWGLHDMHGNVWEWVWDGYGPYPDTAPVGYSMLDGRGGRVVRGGAFNYVPWKLRSAFRLWIWPTFTYAYIGFRCARGSIPAQ